MHDIDFNKIFGKLFNQITRCNNIEIWIRIFYSTEEIFFARSELTLFEQNMNFVSLEMLFSLL